MLFHMHLMAAPGDRLVRVLEHIDGNRYYVAWRYLDRFQWGNESGMRQALLTKTTIEHEA